MSDVYCVGCEHYHRCQPNDAGICEWYCRTCDVDLAVDGVECQADMVIDTLQQIHRVNPSLLLDVVAGRIDFDTASRMVTEVDRIVSCVEADMRREQEPPA